MEDEEKVNMDDIASLKNPDKRGDSHWRNNATAHYNDWILFIPSYIPMTKVQDQE